MPVYDPDKERQRLGGVYAGMSNGELEELADDAPTLTEVARATLQSEILRRGLAVTLRESAAADEESTRFVTVRRFVNVQDALVAKNVLDSAGIECYLGDENVIRMDWFWSNFLGGVKLRVPRDEVAAAAELLDQSALEAFDVAGAGEYRQPRCPNCQSLDVSFRELINGVAYGSLAAAWFTGIVPPLPLTRLGWKCHSCGHAWENPGEDSQ